MEKAVCEDKIKVYHITCSTDNNYVQHCMAMLCSLFENNKGYIFNVHLLHHGLSVEGQVLITTLCKNYKNMITFYDIDEKLTAEFRISEDHPNLSVATYYRLLLPSLLNEDVDRLLYLDCDVIVLTNIMELYNLDLVGYGVAAVRDATPVNNHHRLIMGLELNDIAFCAGVLMINLSYWREHNCQQNMLKYINKMGARLILEDQDVLNHEFHNHWFQLAHKYSKFPMALAVIDQAQKKADILEYAFSPSILHYASFTKPWLNISIPDGNYYWKYVKLSGFPNPKKTIISKAETRRLQRMKLRFYLNTYIRPFIPDLIELFLKDVANILVLPLWIFRKDDFKKYRLKRWLSKYGLI